MSEETRWSNTWPAEALAVYRKPKDSDLKSKERNSIRIIEQWTKRELAMKIEPQRIEREPTNEVIKRSIVLLVRIERRTKKRT